MSPSYTSVGSPKGGLGARLDMLGRSRGGVGAPSGAEACALLTFVEESRAGPSLDLAQRQHFCDHLCQTAGQLGVEGQRGG